MDVLTRLAALLIAILLAIDAFSGYRTETLRVAGHTRAPRWHQDDDYRLHFLGGRVESCGFGLAAWNALRDGDEVAVDTSRVFKTCDGIRRGEELLARRNLHKWLLLLPIAMLLAAALGWIRFERDVRRERRGWFGLRSRR
jgi:hypothetical protein